MNIIETIAYAITEAIMHVVRTFLQIIVACGVMILILIFILFALGILHLRKKKD